MKYIELLRVASDTVTIIPGTKTMCWSQDTWDPSHVLLGRSLASEKRIYEMAP
jgi:hypothetical protein